MPHNNDPSVHTLVRLKREWRAKYDTALEACRLGFYGAEKRANAAARVIDVIDSCLYPRYLKLGDNVSPLPMPTIVGCCLRHDYVLFEFPHSTLAESRISLVCPECMRECVKQTQQEVEEQFEY